MTGTLDRIEANMQWGPAHPRRYPTWPEIEALVEVAKAAQHVANHQWSPLDRDWPDGTPSPMITLRAALARLEDNE